MIEVVLKRISPLNTLIGFVRNVLKNYKEEHDFKIMIDPLIMSSGIYLIFWIYSVYSQDISHLNLSWQISLLIQISYYLINSNSLTLEKTTFSIVVLVHLIRLIIYLSIRNYENYENYKNYKKTSKTHRKFGSYKQGFRFYQLFTRFLPQLFCNFIVGTPFFIFLNSKSNIKPLIYWNGLIIMILGSFFENIADVQLYLYKKKFNKMNQVINEIQISRPGPTSKLLNFGVWAVSRHPNFFGESVFWWGIFTCCVSQGYIFTIYASLIVTLGIILFSIPQLERHLKEQYGLAYKNYMKRVSCLIPWIPKNYSTFSKQEITHSIMRENINKNPEVLNFKKHQKNEKLNENKKKFYININNKLKKHLRNSNNHQFYKILQ
jgi:steroid 5-alpha reductase family enzyme